MEENEAQSQENTAWFSWQVVWCFSWGFLLALVLYQTSRQSKGISEPHVIQLMENALPFTVNKGECQQKQRKQPEDSKRPSLGH